MGSSLLLSALEEGKLDGATCASDTSALQQSVNFQGRPKHDERISIVLHGGHPDDAWFEQFAVGDVCKVVNPATMRVGESLETDFICDLDPTALLIVVKTTTTRRMKVKVCASGQVGWVSVRTRAGDALVT